MRKKDLVQKIIDFLGSNKFFLAIILLAIFQGLWYAFTHRPHSYDENFHVFFINFYTSTWSPFIEIQSTGLDYLGEITRNPNYLFYYLMSIPFRIIKLISADYTIQVILLRTISIGLFVGGLILYRKVLDKIQPSKSFSNISMLFLILIPALAPLSGVVSYDNILFLLIPAAFLLFIKILQEKLSIVSLMYFITLTLFICLMKFTAIPFVIFMYLLIAINIKNRYKLIKLRKLLKRDLSQNKIKIILVSLPMIVCVLLFLERPVLNTLVYGNPTPECIKILPRDRCIKNYTAERNILFDESKPDNFRPIDPAQFFLSYWLPGVIRTEYRVAPNIRVPVMVIIAHSITIGGLLLITYYLSAILSKKELFKNIVIVCSLYVVFLILYNYYDYIRFGQPIAIKIRYLLHILPVFILLLIMSTNMLMNTFISNFKYRKEIKTSLFITCILLLIIGGAGIASTALSSDDYEWKHKSAQAINDNFDKVIRKITIGN